MHKVEDAGACSGLFWGILVVEVKKDSNGGEEKRQSVEVEFALNVC